MFSSLDAYEALDPVIVLWGDDRWAECIRELRTARWHSYDIEGYDGAPQPPRGARVVVHEDGTAERKKAPSGRERINIHTFVPRLLQVALPSGRVMIADLGGIRDNRDERHVQYAEFLAELRAALYDPERLTVRGVERVEQLRCAGGAERERVLELAAGRAGVGGLRLTV